MVLKTRSMKLRNPRSIGGARRRRRTVEPATARIVDAGIHLCCAPSWVIDQTHGGTMDRFRRAKSIAAFRAVIRHRKVSWPTASVPPRGPDQVLRVLRYAPPANFQEVSTPSHRSVVTRDRPSPAAFAATKIVVVAEDAGRIVLTRRIVLTTGRYPLRGSRRRS